MTAPRLTIHDQLLINLCGWLATARFKDETFPMMIGQVARVIPHCSDHPLIVDLAHAASAVVRAAKAPSSTEFWQARLDLDAGVQAVFYARAAQAAAQIWPEENTTAPAAEEPAHAAE